MIGLLAIALAPACFARAVESPIPFDLPQEAAAKSLKRFSEQAGREVLFSSAVTAGVRTNRVKGEMLPRAAIDTMLANTGLVAVYDSETGAYSVRRQTEAEAKKRSAEDRESLLGKKKANEPEPLEEPSSSMNPRKRNSWLGGLLALVMAADSLPAQSTASSTSPLPSPTDEPPTALSPFVVSTEKDTGYQASSTLAGTRLNTPIKDLAASISIYTKDFLEDIGATSSNDLLIYATGMEAAGPGGNFSAATNDINADRPSGDAARVDPQSGSRTRGLATPTFTRDYFTTRIAFDSYNTSTVTVNRGPNAALFGAGSAAGVVNTTLVSADLNRDINKVTTRYGSNDAARATLDFNRVLIPRKLAARIVLLQDNQKYQQRPAFEDKKRIYGTFTFQPFKTTTLRGNFESGNTRANRPIMLLPSNDVSSQWLAAGRPGYDWSFYDDPARNPAAASTAAGPVIQGQLMAPVNVTGQLIFYANPTDKTPSDAFNFRNLTTTTYARNAIASQIFNPLVNRDQATDAIQFVHTVNVWDLPAAYWTGANVPPGQQPGYVPVGMKLQSFTDYSAFDWKHQMIDQSSRQGDSFRTVNLAFAQTAWDDRIGLEVVYDGQRIDRVAKNSFFGGPNNNRIMVDTNVTLPDGRPNPNYGRPFAAAAVLVWRDYSEESDSGRATAYIKYDFKDLNRSWGRWLGRHILTGLYQMDGSTTVTNLRRLHTQGAASQANDPGNIFASQRRPTFITYLGPSIIGNNNPLRLQPIQIPEIRSGRSFPIQYFVRAADQTDPGHFERDSSAAFVDVSAGGSGQRETIKSQAAVLQSYWLKEHLITTLSWRRDEDYLARETIAFRENPADRNDPGQAFYGLNDFSFPHTPPPSVAKETKSFGTVLIWPRKWLGFLRGADLSVFFNKSENFTPIGGRADQFARPLPPPVGNTKEYGLNFTALEGKLNVRLNRFETAVQGVSSNPPFYSALRGAILGVAMNWATEGNSNPQMAAQSNADLELLFSPLPANYRQLYNFVVAGTAPNITASSNTVAVSSNDTVDASATGLEMDVTYNVTKNWRILFNVARQETIQTNQYPDSKNLVALMKPVWDRLSARPAGRYPVDFQPGDTLPANVQTYGQYLDLNIYVPMASALATEGSASAEQRKWRFNFVTNYTFDRNSFLGGILHGWAVGGAVRWQDRLGIGYPSSRDPDGTAHFDIQNPFYAPSDTNVDAWVSYSRRLYHNKIAWKVQLNATNIIGDGSLIPVVAQSWNGTVAQYRLPPERRWYLTNTFSF